MKTLNGFAHKGWLVLAAALLLGMGLAGCEGDDGKDGAAGADGTDGVDGVDGAPGLSCWDLNANGVPDLDTEDINKDGVVDVNDCRTPSGGYDVVSLHKGYFTDNTYTAGGGQCLNCHGKIGDDVMKTAHWKWQGNVTGIAGLEGTTHGKTDLINNFCQAVPANEGRCTMCHIGYGWTDKSFDFDNPKNIDCLACHDQTLTYKKVTAPGGLPDPGIDLQKVAQSVGMNGGVPPRKTCVFCHASAGGDDNVKHGDISTRMGYPKATDPAADPATYLDRSEDVHMGYDPVAKKGGDLKCVACHQARDHGIGGFMYHSTDEGDMKECTDCHQPSIHVGTSAEGLVARHDRLACQVCHIPAIARTTATYVDWKWSLAGQATPPADCPSEPTGVSVTADKGTTQRSTYAKLKGCFTWATNVRPELRYYNGKWNRVIMGVNDKGLDTSKPVDLGSPSATYRDADAKIYPFKKMTGNQPFDAVDKTVLVPHLWGKVTGPNPYWEMFDWNLALQDASAYSATLTNYGGFQQYNGSYVFADTVMLLKVDHEVAPKEMALGRNNGCGDCHFSGQIDWPALGWTRDPVEGGEQTLP